ncbi:MAG: phosphopantothenate/pantothenate synthetase [Candidatus Kariarchaeaceae archaeon]|jgi:4-phosphopantoate--beta-alanine ligase
MGDDVPQTHPRAKSLEFRHRIIDGMHKKIVAEAGLIAHGRGEAFDYLIGEKTHEFSKKACEAAAASLYLADNPVLSVNGNVTVLCPEELVSFSNASGIPLEINLFYRKEGRLEAITSVLLEYGAKTILGIEEEYFEEINEISSQRRIVDRRGIGKADVVFVPLEDGDRTEGLVREGKTVITVDLNPLSRTSIKANITIVDNIIRALPLIHEFYEQMNEENARRILATYDNQEIIRLALSTISEFWQDMI